MVMPAQHLSSSWVQDWFHGTLDFLKHTPDPIFRRQEEEGCTEDREKSVPTLESQGLRKALAGICFLNPSLSQIGDHFCCLLGIRKKVLSQPIRGTGVGLHELSNQAAARGESLTPKIFLLGGLQ